MLNKIKLMYFYDLQIRNAFDEVFKLNYLDNFW